MKDQRLLLIITIIILILAVIAKAQFTVQPLSVERAEGLEAVFRCQYQAEGLTVTYDWVIDNVIVTIDTETVRQRVPSSPGEPATLTIVATQQHNNSVVYCEADIRNGTDRAFEISSAASLVVRETIITHLIVAPNTITVKWNAVPPTEYRVDINRTTLGSTDSPIVLDSVPGLAEEHIFMYMYMYPNPSVCDRFSFTVTPTKGEMRGTTSNAMTGFFTRAEGDIEEPPRIRENGENKSVEFEATIPKCTNFTRYRVDSGPFKISVTDPLFDGSLSFSLPTDKMTEYNITLTDVNGIDLVFENIPISTFDVQDLLVSECPSGGGTCVSIVYVEGTLSPGALVCAVRIINGVLDFARMKLFTIPRNSNENFTLPVPSGEYRLIAFDLESTHLPRMPMSMVAHSLNNMTVNSTVVDASSPPVSGISATKIPNGDVEVTCSDIARNCLALFQSSSILDRVIIGFINTSLSSNVTLGNIGFADDGYVVVYSWNSEESIFEGNVSLIVPLDPPTTAPTTTPTSDSQTDLPSENTSATTLIVPGVTIGASIGVLVVVIILIVLIVCVVLCLVNKWKRDSKVFHSSNSEVGFNFQELDVGAPITSQEQVAFYDVARPENMSPECNKVHIDDVPPPAYDVVRKENMQCPEYETVASARAGNATPAASEKPPPLPPPMISEDSEAPGLPPPYNPAVDNESNDLLVESSMNQGVESQSVDGGVDESVEKVRDMDRDGTTEEATGSTEAQPGDMDQSLLESEGVDTMDGLVLRGAEDGARGSADHSGQEAMIAGQHQYALVDPKPAINDDKVMDMTKVVYAKVDKAKLKPVDPPPVPKAQGITSQYTQVETKAARSVAKVMDTTKVVYVEVDKDKFKPVNSSEPPALPPRRPATDTGDHGITGGLQAEKTLALPPRQRPPPPPPTHESLMALLSPIAKKWEDIANVLRFDEDRVDEIFTNNETDCLRLHELLDYYFMNVHCSHSWEEMVRVLTDIEEHGLAGRIQAEKIQGAEALQFSSVV